MKKTMTGHKAVAEAMRQIEPDVVAVYPITPQSEIAEYYAQYVADGIVHTELVPVESEHSAMSACVGAAAAGARVMTATASQGLALMVEIVYIAASMRLPIVMALANRPCPAPSTSTATIRTRTWPGMQGWCTSSPSPPKRPTTG